MMATHHARGGTCRAPLAAQAGRSIRTITLALFFASTGALAAHGQTVTPLLPDSVADHVVAFYNRIGTTRLSGDAHIGAGTAMRGDVAVLGGTLTLDGVVEGDVVVINGGFVVRGVAARVDGSVTVVGGEARSASAADAPPPPLADVIAGGVNVYREPLRFRYQDGGIARVVTDETRGLSAGRDFAFGRTDIMVAAHGAYNRVEGLPIAVGPRIRFAGPHPTTARALVIARTATAADLELHRFGYDLRAEQLVAPELGLTVGARLYSEVAAIESWGLSDRESALATFVLRQDFRDHYEREGWSLYARLARPGSRYHVDIAYRDEEHVSTPAADPFTLIRRSSDWRPQTAVAEGALRSIVVGGTWDTRNEERDPSAGWLIHAEIEHGLGGSLDDRGMTDPSAPDVVASARTGYRTAEFDVRRYARLSPYARLGLRVFGAGSLDARSLPPQRQHTLGGEGSLPGYRAFEFDCGARMSTVELRGRTFHPYYGCDQVVLVQLEYQAGFPFARRLAEAAGLAGSVGQLVRWVAFFDAGRAWIEPDARHGRHGGGDDFSADAGVGLRVGPLGAYWAVPLSGRGQGFNFFVRLGPRI
jgi:hypothetical protein